MATKKRPAKPAKKAAKRPAKKKAPQLKLEYVKTAKLIPYAGNSRTHSDEQIGQIAASIREFGFLVPILANPNNSIVAGHGRLSAAFLLGLEEVPVIRATHLTKAQKRAYVIADNKLALNAGWDMELLGIEIAGLDDMGFDIELLGFSNDELKDLLNPGGDGLTDPDAVPEPPETPVTVLGDLWTLGDHKLLCGDATSLEDVARVCGTDMVDIFVTDPPYNVDYTGKTKDALKLENDSMDDASFRQFLTDAYTAADSVMKAGAVFYVWHADSEGYNFRGAAVDTGWQVRQCLIWNKQHMVMGRQDYHWKHEPCLYGWKGGAGHLWATDRKQVTVLEFDRPAASREHPTMKPVDLMEYQITNNTKGSDIVLDSFGGSGSTMIACEKSGRRARILELDPVYCDVSIKRWQEYTGKTATNEDGRAFPESEEG